MRLTERQLNRATLERQLLLRRRSAGAVDAVRAVCAIQAQSPASPYIALWNRVEGFDPAELDRAYAEHRIVKATLMRITLHVVAAEDFPVFHAAMAHDLRRARLADRRFVAHGMSTTDAEALLPEVMAFAGQARTNAEFDAMLAERVGSGASPGPWWAFRTFAPLVHAPTGGAWSFGDRPSYVDARLGAHSGSEEAALAALMRRYLAAFGPASEADFGQFTMVLRPRSRAALDLLADELVTYEAPDGRLLYDVRGGNVPHADTPAPPRLMAMWDSILFAYRDRARVLPEPYRRLVIRSNGDTLPAVLVDGHVAGVWRPAPDGTGGLEVTAFHPLDDATWDGLDEEGRSLVTLVADRQPDVYRRYARWWTDLPAAEVRILGR
jgi:Winged helix DNA-binding domain